ncbi:hypothetical protein HDV05_002942 [Chytridiales sp. JEL 0842]|nr:hypothetical protein HDV05_002942 [Chytridiales sp. JEL 0842]
MALLLFNGVVGSVTINQAFIMRSVPYPARLFQGLKMTVLTTTCEVCFVCLPIPPMIVAYTASGVNGVFLKALTLTIFFKFAQVQLRNASKEQKAAMQVHDEERAKAIKEELCRIGDARVAMMEDEEPSTTQGATAEFKQIAGSMIKPPPNRIAPEYISTESISTTNATSVSGTTIIDASTIQQDTHSPSDWFATLTEQQLPPIEAKNHVIINSKTQLKRQSLADAYATISDGRNIQENFIKFKLFSWFTFSSFYLIIGTILIRQEALDYSIFYLTAGLSALADLIQKLIINHVLVGRYNRRLKQEIANVAFTADAEDVLQKMRIKNIRRIQVYASGRLGDNLSFQLAYFCSGLFVFLFTSPDSPFLTFSASCAQRVSLKLSTIVGRTVFMLMLQNVSMMIEVVLLQRVWGVDVYVASLELKPVFAAYGAWCGWLLCYGASAMLVIRGLLPEEFDHSLLACCVSTWRGMRQERRLSVTFEDMLVAICCGAVGMEMFTQSTHASVVYVNWADAMNDLTSVNRAGIPIDNLVFDLFWFGDSLDRDVNSKFGALALDPTNFTYLSLMRFGFHGSFQKAWACWRLLVVWLSCMSAL